MNHLPLFPDKTATPPLIRHFEASLGASWQGHRFDNKERIQFLEFDNQPVAGAVTFLTLGLSHHLLRHPNGAVIRQELLVCQRRLESPDQSLLPLLAILASDIASSHIAVPRGHVIGPSGPIVPSASVEAFYFTEPLYHPEQLLVFRESDPPTFVMWAIPVSPQEAAFAQTNGADAFEDLLRDRDPDALDLQRVSIL